MRPSATNRMETSRVSHLHGQVQLLTFVKPPCWARALQVRTARTVQSAAAAEPAAVQTFSAGSLRRQRATHGRPCQAREPAGRAAPGRVSKQSIEQNATAAVNPVIRRWVACMASPSLTLLKAPTGAWNSGQRMMGGRCWSYLRRTAPVPCSGELVHACARRNAPIRQRRRHCAMPELS